MNAQQKGKRKPAGQPFTPPVLFGYVLVGCMLACLAYAVSQILASIFPGWNGWYIPLLAFFVAFEGVTTYRLLRQSASSFSEWAAWRLSEWVVLAILLKLALYVLTNPTGLLADLQSWPKAFLASFFTDDYVLTLGIALVVWLAANSFAEILFTLEENTEEWDLERQGVAVKDRADIRQNLMAHVFGYGAVLLAVTAFLNLEIVFLPVRFQRVTINTLVFTLYFVFGLILLAQSQFSVMRAQWYLNDIPSSPAITARWLRTSILLVLGIALLVILLPTGYAVGIFDLLQILLSVVVFIGLVLQFLILTPLLLLLAWLARLLGSQGIIDIPEPIPPQPPPPPPVGDHLPWLEVLRSILFWLIFAAVIYYSFRHYVRQHGGLGAVLSRAAPARWLSGLWHWLLSVTGKSGLRVQQAIRLGVNRVRRAGMGAIAAVPGQNVVFDRLPPRQQILLTYLAMLAWLKQNGVERRNSSTPQEYARQLTGVLPDASPDIEGITHLFIEARYSQHAISGEQSRKARSLWERIRQQVLAKREQQAQDGRETA